MKTCKKCKKQVPNNMKICKYCGTDLSKVKPQDKKNPNNKKTPIKSEKIAKKETIETYETEILETKMYNLNDKTEVLYNVDELNKQADILSDKTEYLDLTTTIDTKKKTKKNNKKETNDLVDDNDASSFNIFGSDIKKNIKKEEITKANQIYLAKKKISRHKFAKVFGVLLLLLIIVFIMLKGIDYYKDRGYVVEGTEKISDVTFKTNDVITYNDVRFKVLGVTLSDGTAYKKPKTGNKFLIVNIRLENEKNNKYHYSGKYFTMGNDKVQTERIISPVNAGSDLYSGDLVIGGTKEGSVVFEQSMEEKEIYLYYYDQKQYDEYLEARDQKKEDSEKEENTDKVLPPKPIFRIKIEMPLGTSN